MKDVFWNGLRNREFLERTIYLIQVVPDGVNDQEKLRSRISRHFSNSFTKYCEKIVDVTGRDLFIYN